MSIRKIAVIGGDMRQLSMAGALARKDGRTVMLYGIDPSFTDSPPDGVQWAASVHQACAGAQAVILPLPASVDHLHIHCPLGGSDLPIDRLFGCLDACRILLGGRLDREILALAGQAGITAVDYAETEEFAIRNALPTAEGALEIALAELPVTIRDSRLLVCGYGRVGEALAGLLHSLGAQVTAAARRPAVRAKIEAAGLTAISPEEIGSWPGDAIFNTVPQPILGENALAGRPPGTLLVELASRPGGFDLAVVERLGLNVIFAPGLPGKTAPVSAGRILAACVENIWKEALPHDGT